MLLFIMSQKDLADLLNVFQYISCYCLSLKFPTLPYSEIKFQYISCYCLSWLPRAIRSGVPNFNTSHVTVYPGKPVSKDGKNTFQYISCYCLSHHQLNSALIILNFNTSHVTVYPILDSDTKCSYQFQYISCYCLSSVRPSDFCYRPSFQYISCYCLSLSVP